MGNPRRTSIAGTSWSGRLTHLRALGVTVLLCGGFNRLFRPHAEDLGLRVEWGLAGYATDLAAAFARDDLDRYRFSRCPQRGQGRRRQRWGRRKED